VQYGGWDNPAVPATTGGTEIRLLNPWSWTDGVMELGTRRLLAVTPSFVGSAIFELAALAEHPRFPFLGIAQECQEMAASVVLLRLRSLANRLRPNADGAVAVRRVEHTSVGDRPTPSTGTASGRGSSDSVRGRRQRTGTAARVVANGLGAVLVGARHSLPDLADSRCCGCPERVERRQPRACRESRPSFHCQVRIDARGNAIGSPFRLSQKSFGPDRHSQSNRLRHLRCVQDDFAAAGDAGANRIAIENGPVPAPVPVQAPRHRRRTWSRHLLPSPRRNLPRGGHGDQ
jgi:hypothetical protein